MNEVAITRPPLAVHLPLTRHADCKCCGNSARLDGYADLDRDCFGHNERRGNVSGVPIPYYRCAACDFTFTPAFDGWTPEDFARHIYNDEYALFDPRFAEERPKTTARLVGSLARDPRTRILDYGCGNGRTVELLRALGYTEVQGFDPFHANPQPPATGVFDLVICIEVAEHTPSPLDLFARLASHTAPHGVILVSTRDFSEVNGRWSDDWYVAPRNGHVSFYSQRTLRLLAASLQRDYVKLDSFRHLLVPRPA